MVGAHPGRGRPQHLLPGGRRAYPQERPVAHRGQGGPGDRQVPHLRAVGDLQGEEGRPGDTPRRGAPRELRLLRPGAHPPHRGPQQPRDIRVVPGGGHETPHEGGVHRRQRRPLKQARAHLPLRGDDHEGRVHRGLRRGADPGGAVGGVLGQEGVRHIGGADNRARGVRRAPHGGGVLNGQGP